MMDLQILGVTNETLFLTTCHVGRAPIAGAGRSLPL